MQARQRIVLGELFEIIPVRLGSRDVGVQADDAGGPPLCVAVRHVTPPEDPSIAPVQALQAVRTLERVAVFRGIRQLTLRFHDFFEIVRMDLLFPRFEASGELFRRIPEHGKPARAVIHFVRNGVPVPQAVPGCIERGKQAAVFRRPLFVAFLNKPKRLPGARHADGATIRIPAQDGAPHPYFDIRAVFLADPQIIRKLVSEQRLFDDELIAAIVAFFGVETLFPFIKVEHTRYGLGIPEQAGAVGVDPQRPLFQRTVPETDLCLPFGHGAHRRQIGHRAGSDLKLSGDADRPAFGVPFQYKQPFSDKKVLDRIRRLQKAPVPADNAFTQLAKRLQATFRDMFKKCRHCGGAFPIGQAKGQPGSLAEEKPIRRDMPFPKFFSGIERN